MRDDVDRAFGELMTRYLHVNDDICPIIQDDFGCYQNVLSEDYFQDMFEKRNEVNDDNYKDIFPIASFKTLKKLARLIESHKDIVARYIITDILNLQVARDIITIMLSPQDLHNLEVNMMLWTKSLYILIYGKYDDDLAIDALLQPGCFTYNTDTKGGKTICGTNFDLYCKRKLAELIKRDDTFCNKFFVHFSKYGISSNVFKYLLHHSPAKEKLEKYILENNIGVCFIEQEAYAIDPSKNMNTENQCIQKINDDIKNMYLMNRKCGKDYVNFNIKINDKYSDAVINVDKSDCTLLLPYKSGEQKIQNDKWHSISI